MQLLDPNIEGYDARELFVIKNAKAFHLGEITDYDDVGVRSVNPVTLEVELSSSASYFLYLLANIFPIPKHVVEANSESWADWEKIVINGPFQPESIKSGESITLVRNPTYNGRFPGNLQKVQISLMKFQQDESEGMGVRLDMYKKDRVDILRIGDEISRTRHQHAEEYISEPIPGLYFFAFDPSQAPFDDRKVRKAFALALDKGKMVEEISGALLYPAYGGFVPLGIPGHSPGIDLPFNPAKARQLLAEAGYPGGEGFPSHKIAWVMEDQSLENLFTQLLDNLNVEVTLEVMDYEKAFIEARQRKLFYVGWRASILDPDNFLRVCIREALPSWRNENYDRLLEEAKSTLDQDERIQLYHAADKLLIEEAVVIPIDYTQAHYLIKPWVKIPVGTIGEWNFKDVIIEPH
jgi:oligopeptide transport system substrate-binding protein